MIGMAQTSSSIKVVTEVPNLRERTVKVLRDAILGLQFKPGERLIERELCEATGVSRTSLREALRNIEAEGLITRLPNKGMFITVVTVDDARQIYEVRATLESDMSRQFIERATPIEYTNLRKAYERIEATIFGDDVLAYAKALDGFSETLAEGAHNELARQLLGMVRARVTFLRATTAKVATRELKEGTLKSLQKILNALEARKSDLAAKACRDYVARSAAFAFEVLNNQANAAEHP